MCEGVRVTGLQGINKQGVIKFTRVYIEKENWFIIRHSKADTTRHDRKCVIIVEYNWIGELYNDWT